MNRNGNLRTDQMIKAVKVSSRYLFELNRIEGRFVDVRSLIQWMYELLHVSWACQAADKFYG